MKFLLFFVSIIFSFIFYIFHSLSKGVDVLGNKISNSVELLSFSSNLLIESFIFLLLGIIFLYLFSDLKNKGQISIKAYKIEIFYFLFYIIFVFYIYFFYKSLDLFIISIIIIFILSDILFNHLSNLSSLEKEKIHFKYLGLILNYISGLLSMCYIFIYDFSFIPFFILIFNAIFNILIHKNYTNYISLVISILIILFLFYSLFFSLFELYILYI